MFLFCEKAPAAYSVVRLKTHKEPPTFFMERAHVARLSQTPNQTEIQTEIKHQTEIQQLTDNVMTQVHNILLI